MINFWRGASALALVAAALTGCATPSYPTHEGYTPPRPLISPKPQYPTHEDAAPAPKAAPAPAPALADPPAAPAIPPPAVQSQPLTPLSPSGAGPSASSAPSAPAAGADSSTAPAAPASTNQAPVAAAPMTPTQTSTSPTMAPRAVVHDQPATPAPMVRSRAIPAASETTDDTAVPAGPRFAVAGRVIEAEDIFEDYEVQKGDHVDALARAFNTNRSVLLDANDLKPPYPLHPGQILKVPVAKAYVAQSGDTLSAVGKRFGVEADQLAQINHISARAALRPGQKIGLPSSMHDRGPLRLGPPPTQVAENRRQPATSEQAGYYAHPGLTPLLPEHAAPQPLLSPQPRVSYETPIPQQRPAEAAPSMSDAQIATAAHGRFVWPVHGDIVSGFGPKGVGRRNDGVDIKAAQGVVVQAAADGDVVYAGDQVPGFGNLVLVKHADGWVTAYAHLDKVAVAMKQHVTQGEELGSVGMTGGLSEPQLHFEVRYAPTTTDKARPVDPVLVLPH